MKKALRILLTCILMAVFLFSSTKAFLRLKDKASGSSAYDQALQIALSGAAGTSAKEQTREMEAEKRMQWIPAPLEDEDVHVQTLEGLNLDALQEVNPDVLGWILIPDTLVNYPIVQSRDNHFYLNRTWDGKSNSVGSIFLECNNAPDFADFNTIVYGHNMNDGSMFAQIRKYRNQAYWEEHPFVYIRTDAGVFRYEVFSAYQTPVDSNTYRLSFSSEEDRDAFLTEALENSRIDAGVVPEATDRILTMSTCSGGGYSTRWVVHARLSMIPVETEVPLDF